MEKTKTEKIIERIKTLEDAMAATGMTLPPEEQLASLPKDVVTFMKLRIIAAALNGLTKDTLHEFPTFDVKEIRYFPWFYFYSKSEIKNMSKAEKENLLIWGAGFAIPYTHADWRRSGRGLAARLAVKSHDIAIYFGRQFIDIWKDYITCQD